MSGIGATASFNRIRLKTLKIAAKEADSRLMATKKWGPAACAAVVSGVRFGEVQAKELLYEIASGFQWYFQKKIGSEYALDFVHDLYLLLITSIQQDKIYQSEKLMGFSVTAARFLVCNEYTRRRRPIDSMDDQPGLAARLADNRLHPEAQLGAQQRVQIGMAVMTKLVDRQREILLRYYLLHQQSEHIEHCMSLSPTQFRLLKSKAKAEFGEVGKQAVRVRRSHSALHLREASQGFSDANATQAA